MRLLTTLPGVLIVAFALREIFEDLFHPSGSGSLSDYIGRSVFRLFRHRKSLLPAAGPISVVVVILSWTLLLANGFALIYWTNFPVGFRVSTGRDPALETGYMSALYFSLEAITNLGLGDLTPKLVSLRMIVTFEALVGLALVTASVSWIVLLYPALGRMRTLARHVSILFRAQQKCGIPLVGVGAEGLLDELTLNTIRTRVDFIHFPAIYYFSASEDIASLPRAISCLVRFAEEGTSSHNPERVRLAASSLRLALDDLAQVLAERFVRADASDSAEIFRVYAKDHLVSRLG